MMCDGASSAEVDQWLQATIERVGWALMGVEDGRSVGWTYTIGLVDRFDHPELVVVGMGSAAGHLLNELGLRVEAGERLDVSSVPEVGGHLFSIGSVDPAQFSHGAFAVWTSYYRRHIGEYVPPVALQVFPPACLVARVGEPLAWRLDTPDVVLGGRHPRTARRRR